MLALSIHQPWCYFIFCDKPWFKDVENRDWKHQCKERGWFLIHASKSGTHKEWDQACEFAQQAGAQMFPKFDEVKRGGIVGVVNIIAHKRAVRSPWFTGPTGLVLRSPYPLPFQPCPGQLGFFKPQLF